MVNVNDGDFEPPKIHPAIVIIGVIIFLIFMGFIVNEVLNQSPNEEIGFLPAYATIIGMVILVFGVGGIPYSMDIIRNIRKGHDEMNNKNKRKITLGFIIGTISTILFFTYYFVFLKR